MTALNSDILYTKDWKRKSILDQTQADEEMISKLFFYFNYTF